MNLLRPSVRWASLLGLAILLAACTDPSVFAPPVTATVSAQVTTAPTPLENAGLGGGATVYYRVEVPTARDLLYVEVVGADLRISLLTASGSTVGVSTSPTFFASNVGSLATSDGVLPAGAALDALGIDVTYECVGPCVATRTSATSYYVKVENRSSSSRSFGLYAYTFDHNDTFEPNDSSSSAVSVFGQEDLIGAIETLGDQDWFHYTGVSARTLEFSTYDASLGLTLVVDGGPTLEAGDADVVLPGERFRVASSAQRAGPPASSGYVVTIGTTTSTIDGTVTATVDDTTPNPVASAVAVGPGATRIYRVDLPALRDLFYVEAVGTGPFEVRLTTTRGSTLAVSRDAAYFAAEVGDLGLAVADADLGATAIDVAYTCLGPCAAIEPASNSYHVEIENLSSTTSHSFDLYAYTFGANDANEPNDSQGSATLLDVAGVDEGAIEHLGDVDYFVYDAPDTINDYYVVFDPFDLALGLELEILDCAECTVLDGTTGRTVEGLLDGDVLRVRSADGRAGPSASSGYAIEITTTSPAGAGVSSR